MDTQASHYRLTCLHCGREYQDSATGFLLSCPEDHEPALLRAHYSQSHFEVSHEDSGIFRFWKWLPVRRTFPNVPGPVVFQSEYLGQRLGLENLFIVFSGYWPEKSAFMETCSFKELEAWPVCARIPAGENRTLVVSSAGNTAKAFLNVCSLHKIPCLVVVPEVGLPFLKMSRPKAPHVKLLVLQGNVDYLDAIRLGQTISANEAYFPEGGAKNVARRDGMGLVLLSFVEAVGKLPLHYFQAVGSGTGGIANWEMSLRLLQDGRFGTKTMQLHLSQNIPFTPMIDAWEQRSRLLLAMNAVKQRKRLQRINAHVLSNRQPPYSIVGGVYDALIDSGGHMYAISNAEAKRAGAMFLKEEGCDLDPAAEVAVASLEQAVAMGRIGTQDLILLNITGGGYQRREREQQLRCLEPDIVLSLEEFQQGQIWEKL